MNSDPLVLEVNGKFLSPRQVYDQAMGAMHLFESQSQGSSSLNYENLVSTGGVGGRARVVSVVDWVLDVRLAGNAALEDGSSRLIFQKYECEWSRSGRNVRRFLTLLRLWHSLKIGTKQFYKKKGAIPCLVGSEIIRRGLWPIDQYLNGRERE